MARVTTDRPSESLEVEGVSRLSRHCVASRVAYSHPATASTKYVVSMAVFVVDYNEALRLVFILPLRLDESLHVYTLTTGKILCIMGRRPISNPVVERTQTI
jgi:hypothetical protein